MHSGSINMAWDETHGCLLPQPDTTQINNPDVVFTQTAPELNIGRLINKQVIPEMMPSNFHRPTFTIKKLHEDAILPKKANYGDLGYDLFALEDTELPPGQVTKVRTGIACNFPDGYGALLRDRSSVATKQEVFVVAGVIDQGYTGEIIVAMFNPGKIVGGVHVNEYGTPSYFSSWVRFKKGDKIAQMILTPVVDFLVHEVTELNKTERGSDGFGSTGK